jgi:acyl transferase domain-containing protein
MGSSDSTGTGLEPLAVIGLSFRLPGNAETTDAFWNMLISKRSASKVTPRSRFDPDAHYNADASRIGSLSYRGGNFLDGDPVDAFDPLFFSIGAAEAHAMDPVHRLTLETAYRALENAGLSLDQIAGTKTAVFAGSSSTDYATIMNKDPETMAKYHATGASSNMMANRVSWCFNLTGPSASVDAACNSSLTALDLVCQSIWSRNAAMVCRSIPR